MNTLCVHTDKCYNTKNASLVGFFFFFSSRKSSLKDLIRTKHVTIYEEADVKRLLEIDKKCTDLFCEACSSGWKIKAILILIEANNMS